MKRALLLLAIVLVCLANKGDVPRVQLIGLPRAISDSQPLEFQVRCPYHPENRRLVLAAFQDGETEPARSSELDVDVLQEVKWYLPAGNYAILAAVFDARGHELGRDQKLVTVQGQF